MKLGTPKTCGHFSNRKSTTSSVWKTSGGLKQLHLGSTFPPFASGVTIQILRQCFQGQPFPWGGKHFPKQRSQRCLVCRRRDSLLVYAETQSLVWCSRAAGVTVFRQQLRGRGWEDTRLYLIGSIHHHSAEDRRHNSWIAPLVAGWCITHHWTRPLHVSGGGQGPNQEKMFLISLVFRFVIFVCRPSTRWLPSHTRYFRSPSLYTVIGLENKLREKLETEINGSKL